MQPSFRGPRNSGILQGAAECRDSAGIHPGGNPGANLKSISHRCCLFEVAFVWELTKETIVLPLGCLQGGYALTPDTPEQSKPFTKGGMHDAVHKMEESRALQVQTGILNPQTPYTLGTLNRTPFKMNPPHDELCSMKLEF